MLSEAIRGVLTGKVTFTAAGGFPDLFLEACAERRIPLRNVEKGSGWIRATVDEHGYRRVRGAAEKAGMELRIEKRAGLPFLLRRYRRRVGIPVGAVLAAALLLVLSSRLWEIRVTGNEMLSADEILDVMEEAGVRTGVPLRRIDTAAAEYYAKTKLPQLSWIAVNLTGCKATVEVREIIPKPEMTDQTDYADLVAGMDGVIVSADVLEGSGGPEAGEPVEKGDLLVSGTIEMSNGFRRFVNAKAIIRARTKTELKVRVEKREEAERQTVGGSFVSARFFGLTVPFGIVEKNAETEESDRYIQSRKTVFPIGLRRTCWSVFETAPVDWEGDEAALVCFSLFCERAWERYREADVLRMTVARAETGRQATVSSVFECVEEIAERRPFVFDPEG